MQIELKLRSFEEFAYLLRHAFSRIAITLPSSRLTEAAETYSVNASLLNGASLNPVATRASLKDPALKKRSVTPIELSATATECRVN